jgi:large subunit GTPase 1
MHRNAFPLTDRVSTRAYGLVCADGLFHWCGLQELDVLRVQLEPKMTIPRRPAWTKDMPKQALINREKQAFLEWRRGMSQLEDDEGLVLTPFEKNIEMWRQLWRVTERSDVIVQILDCRNPLLYRSLDFEKYVQEIDTNKGNVLLLNKADLLSEEMREAWADYLKEQNIKFMFWSALLPAPVGC